jgi:hypothetical protein
MIRNKKAQIATALLVMIALGFSAAALYAIISFSDGFNFQSSEISRITNDLNFQHQYILEQSTEFGKILVTTCKDCSSDQLLQKGQEFDAERSIKFTGEGNFFAKLRNGEFNFTYLDPDYALKIEDLFVQTSSGNTKLIRRFDICQIFNETGDFIEDC